ncbi:hypothetical protein KV557_24580 [Kitasatospora aureofaciens]|uniref:DUF6744 family protein n=1 Tax=Kitasatospora aureofaciens TaxID=1894 RepID=UPI001C494E94|nr:DUF6744 family protein [Kitasatospora aureofaciens]MBV6700241.1 hypothetical protein [Kitasatospora aureofaciens]
MTAAQPQPPTPDLATGDAVLDAYAAALAGGDAPVLGYLVLYSIFDGDVTRDDLERWFAELKLDPDLLPPPLRPVDAYERITGPDGVRYSYPLDDPTATGRDGSRKRRKTSELGRSAVLMVRPVRRDGDRIVRHIVREVRDEAKTKLRYDTRLGTVVFNRDHTTTTDGAGTLHVEPDHQAIAKLPQAEQATVNQMIESLKTSYQRRCTYLTGDKLRSLVRRYVEDLNAIRVRPTGGVYYVHRQHSPALAALRELVSRFGKGSHLVRVPLPDQDEMREMIVTAFTTKAKDDLDRLAKDIAAAQRTGRTADVKRLYDRFAALQKTTDEHAALLSTSLDDTASALQLVKLQLGSLLATADA